MGRPWDGYGDAIYAARYVPGLIPDLGSRTLLVTPSLARLFSGLGLPVCGIVQPSWSIADATEFLTGSRSAQLPHRHDAVLLTGNGEEPTRCDLIYEPGWVSRRGGIGVGPQPPLRLWADPTLHLAPSSRRRIGLCWHGSPGLWPHDPRAIPETALAPLFDLPYDFVKLHEQQLAVLGVKDWAGTAAVICQLDLVITTDTAVAHLAGTMNKKTWLLLSDAPSATWCGSAPSSTPAYPSIRLFRQYTPGDWSGVIAAIHHLLTDSSRDPECWETSPLPTVSP